MKKLTIFFVFTLATQATISFCEESLSFDRDKIIDVEGYWASSSNPAKDTYEGKYPFPQKNELPWPGKDIFLQKLLRMEKDAQENKSSRIGITTYRGFAMSRFEWKGLGCSEYYDRIANISWTDAFGWYYVSKFNVKPSKEFFD